MNKNIWLKVTLLITNMLTMMAGAIVTPALPKISEHFQYLENAELLTKLVITLPGLFIAIFAPLFGLIIDKFGRRKVLIFGLLLYSVSGTSGAFLDDMTLLLLGRVFLGLSVAAVMTTITTLIGDYFQGAERQKFMGLQGFFMSLGGVVFISLAGFLTKYGWHTPFFIYLFSVPSLIMGLFILYEPEIKRDKKDNQTKVVNIQLPLLKLAVVYFLIFISLVTFYMLPVQLPFLMTEKTGVDAGLIGFAIACPSVAASIISLFFNRILKKLSFPILYVMAFALMGLSYYGLSFSSAYLEFIFFLLVAGLGVGLIMPAGNLWIILLSPESHRGRLLGFATTALFLGQFLSPILMDPVIKFSSLEKSFFWVAIFLLALSIVILFSVRVRKIIISYAK